MKVLVSDKLGEAGVKLFEEAQGISVDVKTGLKPEELEAIIGEYDGLVIRSATKVTAKILAAAKRLKVVGRAGTGLDNVDIPEATKRGVVVMNTPGGNTVTTAEHAIAMMLALSRKIPQGTSTMKAGVWEKKKLEGREIFNKVCGVVGFGNIGKIVADRARGLRMQVIVHDPFISPEVVEKAGFESVSFEDLLARADYITIHVPKTKETADLFNKDAIAKMKTGAMLINCARGGIVNEADLAEALKSGKLEGAALDVFATEPPPADNPLLGLNNLICTPHLGASTAEAQTNVAVAVADQIIDYLLNGTIRNAVNAPSVAGEVLKKIKPMLTLGERMGCLQAQLATEPVSAISVEYAGDFKDLDLAPVTTALLKGFLEPVLKDDVNYVNANVIAKERGITVSESRVQDAPVFSQLITVCAAGANTKHTVSGTIVGKAEPKIVAIDSFRMEMVPQGHILLIHNQDKPGAIGAIATVLGDANINIARMSVGQEQDGERNFIIMTTDNPAPEAVLEKLKGLSMVRNLKTVEL